MDEQISAGLTERPRSIDKTKRPAKWAGRSQACSDSEKGQTGLKQTLHIADVSLIDQKQNHVITRLDHRDVVGN